MTIAYLINSIERTITPFECSGYKDMKKYLPGGISIAWVFHNHGRDVLYVDDEGLLKPAESAFRIKPRTDGQPMFGHGILTGRDNVEVNESGDDIIETTLSPALSTAELAEFIEWTPLEEAFAWLEARAHRPSGTATTERGTIVLSHWGEFLRNVRPG
jgi:hypothetical protein